MIFYFAKNIPTLSPRQTKLEKIRSVASASDGFRPIGPGNTPISNETDIGGEITFIAPYGTCNVYSRNGATIRQIDITSLSDATIDRIYNSAIIHENWIKK